MIRILYSSSATRAACAEGGRWIYLGKEVEPHRRARERLGKEREWFYDERLREASEELRQPFLDFVEEVGARQRDAVTWWSTRFSWKIWMASDLFLSLCYLAVAESAVRQARQGRFPLIVVVEDRWLLRQIRENLSPGQPELWVENRSLLWEALQQILLGAARRVKWLLTTLRSYLRQKRAWPHLRLPVPNRPTAGIASYPSHSAFEAPGEWRDVYLPDLDRLLREEGLEVVRLSAPECAGWERPIAERSGFAYPLILWMNGSRLVRSLCAFWRPQWPPALRVKGHDIRWLCRREGWLEAGRSAMCAYRLHYECLRGALAQGSWRCLIASYENQPWEKLQVLAARAEGIRSVAFQINPFSRFWLSYGLGGRGVDRTALPDTIGSSGEAAHRLLLEYGTPASILSLCGSLRYPELAKRLHGSDGPAADTARRCRILVALPIDPILTRHLLEALAESFPDGGAGEGLAFVIRPHPMCPLHKGWVRFPAEFSRAGFTNLQEELDSCGTVLFAGSTVGFEALAQGKTVIRYRSPRLYDVDESCRPYIPAASDPDLRARLLACVREGWAAGDREDALLLTRGFFAPLNREAVRVLFRDRISIPQQKRPALAESANN